MKISPNEKRVFFYNKHVVYKNYILQEQNRRKKRKRREQKQKKKIKNESKSN